MEAAAHGNSTLGIPESVGKEFVNADKRADDWAPATEHEAAQAVREGHLPSGHKFENTHLFDIRILGTGVSYRAGLKEYTFRDPSIFLTDEIVQRCNGLPVILGHPEAALLDGEEYANRALGTIIQPYIKGDEVWGIARIYDDDVAAELAKGDLSTSPGVRIDTEESAAVEVNGEKLLIEGNPKLIDHIAIVENGVWDKGGPPSGVRADSNTSEGSAASGEDREDEAKPKAATEADIKDTAMAEEKAEGKEAPDYADALTKLSERVDALCAKMADKKDGEDEKEEDKKSDKKDAELDEKEHDKEGEAEKKALAEHEKEEKSDKKDAGAESAALRAQIAALQAQIDAVSRPPSHDEVSAIAGVQARADGIAQMFGEKAPIPMFGESARSYRLRVLAGFRKHSARFKDVALDKLDGTVFDEVEKGIYADAQSAALTPVAAANGRLIPVVSRDAAGREITRFYGDIGATFAPFMGSPVRGRAVNPRRGGN